MNAIETQALTRRFGDLTAVDALTLPIPQGERFALLGVNGAGKTTAIRMLSGLLPPTSGDALLLGKSIVRDTAAAKAAANLSPQETAVAPALSVRENLAFIAGVYGRPRKAALEAADAMIERMGLQSVAKRRAKALSGGWQRRLSIAMGLITDPKILFLDEPTLGLDVLARRELWQVVEALRGKITVVLTTHYLEEAEALSDRVGVMAHGRLVALDTAPALIACTGARNFEDAFVALAAGREAQ